MAFLLCLACATLAWDDAPASDPPKPAASALEVVAALEDVLGDVIERAEPSIVAIHRDKDENASETLAVRGKVSPRRAANARAIPGPLSDEERDAISFDFGSGVVIGDQGEILTAFHVVQGASRLTVRAVDRQVFQAEVIAADPRSDLAVIAPVSVPGEAPPKLKPLPIGDAATLRKGSFLVALGNPYNAARDGRASAGWGILANIARRVEAELDVSPLVGKPVQLPNYPTLLQLDAKLNLGMSGGAVVNMKGELVGLTTTAASPAGFDAMAGYAIPMDRASRRAVETLRRGMEVEYGLLGVRPHMRNTNRIDSVSPNSPAARGDLQRGDEIIAVNDAPVVDFDSLIVAVNSYSAGDRVRLKILRDGREIEKTLVLAKFPVEGEIIATARPPAWRGIRVDYLSTLNASQTGVNLLENIDSGVVTREVEPESPAEKAGLIKGRVIRKVGDEKITSPARFAEVVSQLKGPVTLMTDAGPIVVP